MKHDNDTEANDPLHGTQQLLRSILELKAPQFAATIDWSQPMEFIRREEVTMERDQALEKPREQCVFRFQRTDGFRTTIGFGAELVDEETLRRRGYTLRSTPSSESEED
ncbi:MAG: hypothetical protein ACO3I0_15240 [Limisphaerales bacterium]